MFCYLIELMGLHFSGHVLFPVFIFAQLYMRWLDAMIKGRISTRSMEQARCANVWQDDFEAKGGLILEHYSPVHLPGLGDSLLSSCCC